jgi:hypothetical protein
MTTREQQDLIDGIEKLLRAEPRVEAAWLAGSLGKGQGDAVSDVDTLALAADGMAGEVSKELAANLDGIAKPVLVNALFGGRILNVVTEDWLRFDISIVQGDELDRYDARDLTPLFNRGGRKPPTHPDIPYVTPPDQLLKLVNEFLRVLGLLPVGAAREEWELGLTGIDLLRRMTFDLMLEENAIAPARRGGALHRNPLLTAEQRAALARLPPQAARRDSIVESNQAFAAIFLPRARRLAAKIGMVWPAEFEDATRRHLKRTMGIEISSGT